MKREQVSLCVRIERVYVAGTVTQAVAHEADGGIKMCYVGNSLQEQYILKIEVIFAHGDVVTLFEKLPRSSVRL